jgi:hypothetical protein
MLDLMVNEVMEPTGLLISVLSRKSGRLNL